MDIERVIYKMRVYSVIDLERDGIMLGRSKGGEGATSQIAGARLGRNNHPKAFVHHSRSDTANSGNNIVKNMMIQVVIVQMSSSVYPS